MATVNRSRTGNGTGSMSHSARSDFIDHSKEIMARINEQAYGYLVAMGTEAVKCINQQMESGYNKPIWQTGDLMRDVSYSTMQASRRENVVNS